MMTDWTQFKWSFHVSLHLTFPRKLQPETANDCEKRSDRKFHAWIESEKWVRKLAVLYELHQSREIRSKIQVAGREREKKMIIIINFKASPCAISLSLPTCLCHYSMFLHVSRQSPLSVLWSVIGGTGPTHTHNRRQPVSPSLVQLIRAIDPTSRHTATWDYMLLQKLKYISLGSLKINKHFVWDVLDYPEGGGREE